MLEVKVNNFNRKSNIKLKLNDDCIGAINLYTETNNLITTCKMSEMDKVLDALYILESLR